ncbi:MAG: hypothetical protein WKF41_16880 [Gaiellaceae bacterium]
MPHLHLLHRVDERAARLRDLRAVDPLHLHAGLVLNLLSDQRQTKDSGTAARCLA